MSLQICPICFESLLGMPSEIEVHTVQSIFNLSRAEDLTEAIQMTCCHVYHAECISLWWRISPNCPVCRRSMRCWVRVIWRDTQWIQNSDCLPMPPLNNNNGNRTSRRREHFSVNIEESATETTSNNTGAILITTVVMILLVFAVLYLVSKGLDFP